MSFGIRRVQIAQSASGEFIVNGGNDISSVSVFASGGQLVKQMDNSEPQRLLLVSTDSHKDCIFFELRMCRVMFL